MGPLALPHPGGRAPKAAESLSPSPPPREMADGAPSTPYPGRAIVAGFDTASTECAGGDGASRSASLGPRPPRSRQRSGLDC